MADKVLVTGVSGFLGGHVAARLLDAGYEVRGSLRDLKKAGKVHDTLAKATESGSIDRLELVGLNLTEDGGWATAAQGCRYIQHVASPFVLQRPQRPGRTGRRRHPPGVAGGTRGQGRADCPDLLLCRHRLRPPARPRHSLQRVGLDQYRGRRCQRLCRIEDPCRTRSLGHHGGGRPSAGPRHDQPDCHPRPAARRRSGHLERIGAATAQRHGAGGTAHQLRHRRRPRRRGAACEGDADSGKIPRFELPDWMVRLYSLVDADVRSNLDSLGVVKQSDARKAEALLGHPFITPADATIATARSLIEQGLV